MMTQRDSMTNSLNKYERQEDEENFKLSTSKKIYKQSKRLQTIEFNATHIILFKSLLDFQQTEHL